MKNVTITLDDETASWARVYAAQNNMSVSRMVGELLHQHMRRSRDYELAMRQFLTRKPAKLKGSKGRLPQRDELYDRTRVR